MVTSGTCPSRIRPNPLGFSISTGDRDDRLDIGGVEDKVHGRETETKASVTAGTIFHRTRTPLQLWFAAAWQMTSQKHGVSALGVQRSLGLGSYQTAWAMLHRYRAAMVRPGGRRPRTPSGRC